MSPVWKSAEAAVINGDLAALEVLLREHESLFREQQPPSPFDYSSGDAQTILWRNHAFLNWTEFADHLKTLKNNQFEAAVDAIVAGDEATLRQILNQNPALIGARSARKHHATLLHYVGSNGVEYFHQKCPGNIVAITKILLNAGAEVDSIADMYGKDTTLGLAATSIHPVKAGVQIPLLETLLDAGADMDAHGSIVTACLRNGRQQAAEFLASRGAILNLESAAGVGRLDLVKTLVHEEEQIANGFTWACQYGRTSVVEFFLETGAPPPQLALHWAAYGGHADIVKLLLEREVPLETKDDRFQSTPLGWAMHGWGDPPAEPGNRRHHEVVRLLVSGGAIVNPYWLANETVQADPAMLAALNGNKR